MQIFIKQSSILGIQVSVTVHLRTDMRNTLISCHTFRATGITQYLLNNGTLEKAQLMAAHESPRTTKLYDRSKDEVTLDEVERIMLG